MRQLCLVRSRGSGRQQCEHSGGGGASSWPHPRWGVPLSTLPLGGGPCPPSTRSSWVPGSWDRAGAGVPCPVTHGPCLRRGGGVPSTQSRSPCPAVTAQAGCFLQQHPAAESLQNGTELSEPGSTWAFKAGFSVSTGATPAGSHLRGVVHSPTRLWAAQATWLLMAWTQGFL